MGLYHRYLDRFRTAQCQSWEMANHARRSAHLETRQEWAVPSCNPSQFPVLIYVLCKTLDALLYSCIHRVLHVCETQDRRAIYSCKRLFCLRCLLEEVHHLLELILCDPVRRLPLLVHDLEEDIVLFSQVVRASAAVLDSRGEADVCRRLREDWGVELVISKITENGLWCGNVSFVYFSLGSRADSSLKMEFLSKTGLADAVWSPIYRQTKFSQ